MAEDSGRGVFWRYLGAMMTEKKDGSMAASWTRTLGLVTYLVWMVLIVMQTFGVAEVKVPWELTAGMGSFAGIKGLKDFGKALKGHSSYG